MPEPRLFAELYIDEDITGQLAILIRQHGFAATSAYEAGLGGVSDETQLVYAAEHQLILLTSNRDDFLRLAQAWAVAGRQHHGIVIAQQYSKRQIGELLSLVLSLLNQVTADELINTTCYLTTFR